jgi:polyisoprenoid-binding protein YceI
MKYQFFGIVVFFSLLPAFSSGQTNGKFYSDNKHSYIQYSMKHPLHSWTGKCTEFTSLILADELKNIISQVAVSAKISAFDSKNANRDSHTMEVTEALKFPAVTFSSTSIKQDGDKLVVSGMLSFHGINRNITFEAVRKNNGKLVEVNGEFTIKMTDFNIEQPSLMGMAADDNIKIEFIAVY